MLTAMLKQIEKLGFIWILQVAIIGYQCFAINGEKEYYSGSCDSPTEAVDKVLSKIRETNAT